MVFSHTQCYSLHPKVLWRYTGPVPENAPKNVKLMKWLPQNDLLGLLFAVQLSFVQFLFENILMTMHEVLQHVLFGVIFYSHY